MQPLNDLAKIQLETKRFRNDEKDTAESGILVALPDEFDFYGFWSFAFEESFMNTEKLEKIYKRWQKQIGKKVFWTALAERGNIIEGDEGKFAFVKLTSLIAVAEPDTKAKNIHSDGSGSFGLEK